MLLRSLLSRIRTFTGLGLIGVLLATNLSSAQPPQRLEITQYDRAPKSDVDLSNGLRTERQRLANLARDIGPPRKIESTSRFEIHSPASDLATLEASIRAAKSRMHTRALTIGRELQVPAVGSTPMSIPAIPYPIPTPWSKELSVSPSLRLSAISPPVLRYGVRSAQPSAHRNAITTNAISASIPFTGINSYWRYEEGNVPGAGHYYVNVGGQTNFLFQADDMDIHNKGIDLAFRRTYNSQSQHDYNGTDGSQISNYGDGWTNTFDAHVAYNGTSNAFGPGISLYDIDGARYDFVAASNSSGLIIYASPPGRAGDVLAANSNVIGWHKKNGTVYGFYPPNIGSTIPSEAGLAGRISLINARNSNNHLNFVYTFDTQTSTPQNLNTIAVSTQSGQTATLSFSDVAVGSGKRRLLTSLLRPNGVYTTYQYQNGELYLVSAPVNSTSMTACATTPSFQPANCLSTQYLSNGTGYQLTGIVGPRHFVSGEYASGYIYITYKSSSNSVSQISYAGINNPTIADGYSSGAIQPNYSSANGFYRMINFTAGASALTMSDTDGHQTIYDFNATSGVVTGVSEYVSSSDSLNLAYAYDSANYNLTAETDARGNETDYVYDANGNEVARGLPQLPTSAGTFRPTTYYSYDQYNNIIAYCDAVAVNNANANWGSSPPTASDSLCNPSSIDAEAMTWTTTSADTLGELTARRDQLGYVTTFSYSTSSQGGSVDYGLPTSVTGAAISQADGTSRTPTLTFSYDANGNLVTYSKGSGSYTLTYDYQTKGAAATSAENLLTKVTDPDGDLVEALSYYPDDLKGTSETAAESAVNLPATYSYDGNGNLTQETTHYSCASASNCTAGVTKNWYDGDDRLVEVEKPWNSSDYQNGHDVYDFPWLTRYIYDISRGGTYSLTTTPLSSTTASQTYTFSVHGNLAKTQEYIATAYPTLSSSFTSGSWQDLKASSFDPLDRPTATGNAEDGIQMSNTYDSGSATLGLLSKSCDNVNRCDAISYDALGEEIADNFSVPSGTAEPAKSYLFDPDQRVAIDDVYGFGNESFSYDGAGRLTKKVDFDGGTQSYQNYADGIRSGASVTTNGGQSFSIGYSYRTDGLRQTVAYSMPNSNSAKIGFSYTNAGRESQRNETTSQGASFEPTWQYDAYGRVSSHSMPGGAHSAFQYDAEGNLLASTLTPNSQSSSDGQGATGTDMLTLNVRNELLVSSLSNETNRSANGLMLASTYNSQPVTSSQFDAILGRMLSYDAPPLARYASLCSAGQASASECNDYTSNFTYDSMGNMSSGGTSSSNTMNGNESGYDTARIFDFEHHTVQTSAVNQGSYQWGINHPFRIGSNVLGSSPISYDYDNLHWDGDSLLYTTLPSGVIDDVKLGDMGDYVIPSNSNGNVMFEFLDRDSSGSTIGCDALTGSTVYAVVGFLDRWQPGPNKSYTSPCARAAGSAVPPTPAKQGGYNLASPRVGQGAILGMPRADGIYDAINTFQGGRTYEPAAQTWTSPDAYAGDVANPESQKSFVWNNGNPVAYADPSGFDAIYLQFRQVFQTGFAAVALSGQYHSYILVKHDDGSVVRYSFGPKPDAIGNDHLRLEGQDYDANQKVTKSVLLGSCKGDCTIANGGFNEDSLATVAGALDQEAVQYVGLFGPNSNSAAYTLCVSGGGGSKCDVSLPPLTSAPGGRTLMSTSGEVDYSTVTTDIGNLDPQ